MRRATAILVAAAITAVAIGWLLVVKLPNLFGPQPAPTPQAAPGSDEPVRKIRARLFYVSQDGTRLQALERDVPFGATPAEQAEALVREQLRPAPEPLLAALPEGTTLRALFLTSSGDAYVDLSREAAANHTGGSLDELFSVYAVVNVLTANLPAIARVQILVEGKEVDSLAGHIDLRHPLPRSDRWGDVPGGTPAPEAVTPSPEGEAVPGTPPGARL